MTADFLSEIRETSHGEGVIFSNTPRRDLSTQKIYLAYISFRNESGIKVISTGENLREFVSSRLLLKKNC